MPIGGRGESIFMLGVSDSQGPRRGVGGSGKRKSPRLTHVCGCYYVAGLSRVRGRVTHFVIFRPRGCVRKCAWTSYHREEIF